MNNSRLIIPDELILTTYGSIANLFFIPCGETFSVSVINELEILSIVEEWREQGDVVFVELGLLYLQSHPAIELNSFLGKNSRRDEGSCRFLLDELLRIGFGKAPEALIQLLPEVQIINMSLSNWQHHRERLLAYYFQPRVVITWAELVERIEEAYKQHGGYVYAPIFADWKEINLGQMMWLSYLGVMKKVPPPLQQPKNYAQNATASVDMALIFPHEYPYDGCELYWQRDKGSFFLIYREDGGHRPQMLCRWAKIGLIQLS